MWFISCYPRSDKVSWKSKYSVMHYLRMQKIELEQPLASTYVLCLYELYWLYILEEDLVNLEEIETTRRWQDMLLLTLGIFHSLTYITSLHIFFYILCCSQLPVIFCYQLHYLLPFSMFSYQYIMV